MELSSACFRALSIGTGAIFSPFVVMIRSEKDRKREEEGKGRAERKRAEKMSATELKPSQTIH